MQHSSESGGNGDEMAASVYHLFGVALKDDWAGTAGCTQQPTTKAKLKIKISSNNNKYNTCLLLFQF